MINLRVHGATLSHVVENEEFQRDIIRDVLGENHLFAVLGLFVCCKITQFIPGNSIIKMA